MPGVGHSYGRGLTQRGRRAMVELEVIMTNRRNLTRSTLLDAQRLVCGLLALLALSVALLLGPVAPSSTGPAPEAGSRGTVRLGQGAQGEDASILLGAGTLSVSPMSPTIDAGETVAVDVWISDTADLYGMDFRLCFDSAIVSVPSDNATLLWEVFDPANNFLIRNGVYVSNTLLCPCTSVSTNKWYWYALTQTDDPLNPGYPLPFSGSGRIARLTFQGVAPGTTALHFCYGKGSIKEGTALWPAMVDGSITVSGPTATPTPTQATSTPTATPSLPTQTPTPTLMPALPGDLDGDCDVDVVDIMLVASRWGSTAGDASYDARYDSDSDGDIDVVDIMTVAAHWGEHCSSGL
jgi:hypothetical protein